MTVRVIQLVLSANNARLSSVLASSSAQVRAFESSAERAGGRAKSAGAAIQDGLGKGALAAAAALVFAGAKAIEFDKSMRNVNSLTRLNESGFRDLSKSVLDLARSGQVTQGPQTLAEGLYDIASSGFQGADGLKVLKAAAIDASAGLSTTAVASKAITAVLNAYGLSASQASDVSDVLFQTVNLGVVTFDELAGSIGDVVGTAAAAKVSIAQVGSAVATMTLTGISGAEATTSLNRLLEKLIKPSSALADLYKRLGYESGSSALQQKGLRGVMLDIQHATHGNIDALLALFPEIRAARGALALMSADGRNYAKVAGQIEDKDHRRGAAMRTLNEQMKAVSNQGAALWARAQANMIEVGTRTLPVLIAVMQGAGQAGGAIGKGLNEASKDLQPTWAGLQKTGGELVDIMQILARVFGPIVADIAKLGGAAAVAGLNALATVLGEVFGLLAGHQQVLEALVVLLGLRLVMSAVAAAGGLQKIVASAYETWALRAMYATEGLTGSMKGLLTGGNAVAVVLSVMAVGFLQMRQDAEANKAILGQFADSIKGVFDELGKNPTFADFGDARAKLKDMVVSLQAAQAQFKQFDMTPPPQLQGALDEVTAALSRLDIQQITVQSNVAGLGKAYGLSEAKVRSLASSLGLDLSGSFDKLDGAIYGHIHATGDVTAMQAKLIKAMGDLADSADDAEGRVSALKDALDALMGGQLSVNAATRAWIGGIQDLAKTLAKAKGNLDLNSEAGRNNQEALDKQAGALRDLVVAQASNGASSAALNKTWDSGVAKLRATMRAAGFTKGQIDAYTQSLGLVPGNVKTIVDAAGAARSAAEVAALRAQIARLQGKTVDVVTQFFYKGKEVGGPKPGMSVSQAAGGVWVESYAGGGRRLPKDALIAKNGPALIQWAEPGTGGEAFIPLSPGRRHRSELILAQVADMFGLRLIPAAKGMIAMASGGLTAAEVQDKRYQAIADRADLLRLLQPVKMEIQFSLSGIVSGLQQAAEERQRNLADYRSRVSPNPHDAADDFYKAPNLSLKDYKYALDKQSFQARQWRGELAKIARLAGSDVARQLEDMGEQGVDLVHKMATGTTTAMRQVAASLRSLTPSAQSAMASFKSELDGGTAAAKAFQANLLRIIQRGQAGLAAKIAAMGVDEGGALAAQAAHASNTQLAALGKSTAANATATDPALMQALALAGVLQANPGVGVVGLAGRSGMSAADVYTLVVKYQSSIFGKLGSAATARLTSDLALIAAGKPPSGFAQGGIIGADAARRGLYYRWAEPSSGGEALIPLGASHRARARALWAETGRRLGGAGGGGRVIQVAAGALQVSVRVDGSQLSEQAVKRVAKEAVTGAVQQLADQLAAM